MVSVFMKIDVDDAIQLTHQREYLDLAAAAGDTVWQRGLLRKGYGLCHGTAGNGYVFLDLYRLTNENKWLHRAIKVLYFASSS